MRSVAAAAKTDFNQLPGSIQFHGLLVVFVCVCVLLKWWITLKWMEKYLSAESLKWQPLQKCATNTELDDGQSKSDKCASAAAADDDVRPSQARPRQTQTPKETLSWSSIKWAAAAAAETC